LVRIGIIGAGQLGLMLGEAARQLGHDCVFLDPAEAPPAGRVGDVLRADFGDPDALARLAKRSDVLTYEFENVPVDSLLDVAATIDVYPPPDALRLAQDRLTEKRLFTRLGIPLAAYRQVDSRNDLDTAVAELGLPLVIKTRRFGYDGKGQAVVRSTADLDVAWTTLGKHPLIAEAFVAFDREVSVIGARNPHGAIAVWPLTENRHIDGILHTSTAPVSDDRLFARADDFVRRLLQDLDYVGVLALELFVCDGELLANEFAPRVHNSGHWTIEGSSNSQFRNHILAITGQSPGTADCPAYAGMLNLVGTIPSAVLDLDADTFAVHDYHKAPRPGRKLGHVTVVAKNSADRDRLLAGVAESVTQSTP
jgi:5-(carboxyamino)imidazole ribonucleotide synthase